MKAILLAVACLLWSITAAAQSGKDQANWPKQITTSDAKILVYQPQPDSLTGVKLYCRAAVSVTQNGKAPVFGAIWYLSTISTDRNTRMVTLTSLKVLNVRFPNQDQASQSSIDDFKNILETEIPKWDMDMSMDELNSSLADAKAVMKQASGLNNDPPEIIFVTKPSVLLLFDGQPSFKQVPDSKIQQAVNTAFFVVMDPSDKSYFLYGGEWWYKASDPVKGPWTNIKSPPAEVKKYQEALEKQASASQQGQQGQQGKDQNKAQASSAVPQVIVRTAPAELIQSNGEPDFAPIQGTNLLYMTNSENNTFMYIDKQMYFVLISGRWYTAKAMAGPWTFVPSDQLPADFAKIPEGSEKDQVLASVAGTTAAKEAVMDAQIPQTAAVDRKSASCSVSYDGDPKFVQIKGTSLYRASNTSSTVIMDGKTYYVCEKAVWFVGNSPAGPWIVATSLPADIQNIPPEDPVYNVKYVYIYESTPEVVYVGYLPGYTGCYVYGPTVVYGTGFYYNPWVGPYYYPRPVTYGFAMSYNPWTGWGFGWGFTVGFVSVGFYAHPYGFWGPPVFRPPYCPPYNHFYGPRPVAYRSTYVNVNVNNYNFNRNNVYNGQSGVRPGQGGSGTRPTTQPGTRPGQGGTATRPSTQPAERPGQGGAGTRPTTQPAGGQGNRVNDGAGVSTRPADGGGNRAGSAPGQRNDVYTDRDGNVYKKDQNNNWQKNDGKGWQNGNVDRSSMDRQSQSRDRGQQMNQNRGSLPSSGSMNRGGSGGMNRGGSGGGGSRGGRR
jgi:hypothetical protein